MYFRIMTEKNFYEDLLGIPHLKIDSIEKKEWRLNINQGENALLA